MDTEIETIVGTIEPEILSGSTALEAINRSEIDMQISTAKRYPRSLATFKKRATELATIDEETAESMFYSLKREGKTIEGASVRLAEVIGCTWQNIRYDADIVAIDDKFVTAMGTCIDLENNVAARVRVKRRITDRNGRRYRDDMIGVTSNAAISIALRNAIFKVVPFALVKDVYRAAVETAVGNAETLSVRREKAVAWFAKAGASVDQVLRLLNRAGVEEITLDDLRTLTGLKTAIKDGETTVDAAFMEATSAERTDSLNAKLKSVAPKTPAVNGTPKNGTSNPINGTSGDNNVPAEYRDYTIAGKGSPLCGKSLGEIGADELLTINQSVGRKAGLTQSDELFIARAAEEIALTRAEWELARG